MTVSKIASQIAKASLDSKVSRVEALLKRKVSRVFSIENGEVGYRMKGAFRIARFGSTDSPRKFAENDPLTKRLVPIDENNIAIMHKSINESMPIIYEGLNQDDRFGRDCFEAKFHATLSGELQVNIVYKRPVDEPHWIAAAKLVRNQLYEATGASFVNIIARSKGKILTLADRTYLKECLTIMVDGREEKLEYLQYEGQFSQPNARVNQLMLQWALESTREFVASTTRKGDLLELYCGNGNFTVPLSKFCFRRTLATEASGTAVEAARWALAQNKVTNAEIYRMTSMDIAAALFNDRLFFRLRNVHLNTFRFQTLLVDPPRSGLDTDSIQLLGAHTGQIIYISCNPESMARDLELLKQYCPKNIEIRELVTFDQFPGTEHIECGANIVIS